jgi:NAD+ diphosphatase
MMGTELPDLEDLLGPDDSMLSKKFGKEVVNYFGWSNINRLSFLRPDNVFLHQAFSHEHTSIIVLNNLSPLTHQSPQKLLIKKPADVTTVTGLDLFLKSEDEMIQDYDSKASRPLVVFLGILEDLTADFEYGKYRGKPFFAVDITPRGSYTDAATALIENFTKDGGATFHQATRHATLDDTAGGHSANGSLLIVLLTESDSWHIWASAGDC